MGQYVIHAYWNDDDPGAGKHDEYEMEVETHEDEKRVYYRFLEAQSVTSAAIAQSLDRIAATLDVMFNNSRWGR